MARTYQAFCQGCDLHTNLTIKDAPEDFPDNEDTGHGVTMAELGILTPLRPSRHIDRVMEL